MTIWFIAAAAVLIVELFTGTVYLLVVSAALFGAGLADRLTDSTGISIMTAAVLSALGIWLVHGRLKQRFARARSRSGRFGHRAKRSSRAPSARRYVRSVLPRHALAGAGFAAARSDGLNRSDYR